MKTGFPNKIAVKPEKEIKAPWNFDAPTYDDRTSCYTNAGSHHGVGHRQPVGHEGEPKMRVPCLPYGRVDTMKVAEVPHKNLEIEIKE